MTTQHCTMPFVSVISSSLTFWWPIRSCLIFAKWILVASTFCMKPPSTTTASRSSARSQWLNLHSFSHSLYSFIITPTSLRSEERWMFSAASLSLSAYVFCQHDNFRTSKHRMMKLVQKSWPSSSFSFTINHLLSASSSHHCPCCYCCCMRGVCSF